MEGIEPDKKLNLRQQSKEQSRQRLLDAGRALLLEHGYSGLSARQISARAGVAQSSFYDHFRDKDHLVRTLSETIVGPLRQQLREARLDPASQSWEESLLTMFERVYHFCREEPALVGLVLQELPQRNSPLSQISQEIFETLHADLREDLLKLQARAAMPARTPVDALVSILLGTALYVIQRMLAGLEARPMEVFAGLARLNQAMVMGLGGVDGRSWTVAGSLD